MLQYIVAGCDEGWTLFDHNKMCYISKINRDRKGWPGARELCQTLGGDLASVKDEKTNEFLKSTMMKGGVKQFWLGGVYSHVDAKWKWSDESTWDLEFADGKFADGKPNHTDENDDYLMLNMVTGEWIDVPRREAKKPYFCQKKQNE